MNEQHPEERTPYTMRLDPKILKATTSISRRLKYENFQLVEIALKDLINNKLGNAEERALIK